MTQPRARDLGVPFEGTPGQLNAITDVAEVEVGHVTLIFGDGPRVVGAGPVRTGVTVVLPRGRANPAPVHGGFFNLNGNGEMTGLSYLEDFGLIQGPVGISNTNAIGDVYAGIQRWTAKAFGQAVTPVVSETSDAELSDMQGFHVTAEHAIQAIEAARSGPVEEGNVGGGTGMHAFRFKGGIGTSSRLVDIDRRTLTVGVLVQCNTGARRVLRIAGVPVGAELADRWLPGIKDAAVADATADTDGGSIVIIVATDAPLSPHQLDRVARRAALGLGRLGSFAGNSSGDLVLAFSTAGSAGGVYDAQAVAWTSLANVSLDPIFQATVEATEEAIVNAMVAAQTLTGGDGYTLHALPHAELRAILRKYNRLSGH